MSSWGSQVQLVLWKHVYLIRIRRHYVTTSLEVVFMVLLLNGVWEESVAPYSAAPAKEHFYDVTDPMEPWMRKNFSAGLFAFAPSTGIAPNISEKAAPILGAWTPVVFANESELRRFMENNSVSQDRVGVVFREEGSGLSYVVHFVNGSFDTSLNYAEDLLFPGPRSLDGWDEISRLLPVQYAVESSYLQIVRNGGSNFTDDTPLELQRFPYPRVFEGSESATLYKIIIRFSIGFFVPFCVLVIKLVEEKCDGMKDMLRRTGMADVIYWLGHFSEAGFVVATAVALMYGPLFILPNASRTPFLQYTSSTVVICILALFGIQTILHAMLLSVFIWSKGVSFALSIVYWIFIGAVPYVYFQDLFGNGYYLTSQSEKLVSSLSPIMYLHWCFRAIERYEKYSACLTWANIFEEETTLDNVSVGKLTLVALMSIVLLAFGTWYIDNIAPWNFGVPKSCYFFLSVDYWNPYRRWNIRKEHLMLDTDRFEPEPKNLEPTVHLVHINKRATKTANPIANINLTIYNKQVTVLLGPEGCGHETILNIITGMDVPTSGEAYVNNFDVIGNPQKSWEFLSYCPRRSIIFRDLTVEEHLLYFISLRGESWKEAHEGAMAVLRQLDLIHDKDELAGHLTVRAQRSLCVAIALCFMEKVPVLVLEEPTRLMDPKCRHEVWEMIVRASHKASVLVTTNNMEEAETMGDRIIMVHEGSIVCAGSPSWLRDRFGSKYHLHFTKQMYYRGNQVERLIQNYIGRVVKISETKFEVVYNIGEVSNSAKTAALLRILDKERTRLGIVFMSITITTLEDIYLRVASGEDPRKAGAGDATESVAQKEAENMEALQLVASATTRGVGTCGVLAGLLTKRFFIWRRVWSTRTFKLWLPVLILLATRLFEKSLRKRQYEESLTYRVQNIFNKSYGFVVYDDVQERFVNDLLVPLMKEEHVKLLQIDGTFVEKELLAIAHADIYTYVYWDHYGASVRKGRVRLWYNAQCPHSALLIVNMYHTAVLRYVTGKKDAWITLTNQPVKAAEAHGQDRFIMEYGKINSDRYEELFMARNILFRVVHSLAISLAMCLHSASFILLPILERISGMKHLQFMTGIPEPVYWISNLLFDSVIAFTHSIFFALVLYGNHSFITAPYVGAIYVLFCSYALAALPFCYVFSFLFDDTCRAFSVFPLSLFLAGMVGSLAVDVFGLLVKQTSSFATTLLIVCWGFVCRWFPTYSLTRGIIKVVLLYKYNDLCMTGGQLLMEACRDPDLSVDPRIARCCATMTDDSTKVMLRPLEVSYETGFFEVVTMLAEGLLYMGILALLDSPLFFGVIRRCGRPKHDSHRDQEESGPRLVVVSMDPDVEREYMIVEEIYRTHVFNNVVMAARNLQKWVGCLRKVKLVGPLSFTLRENECLGLIGVNSSGKTTVMNIITGLVVPSFGNAYMPNVSLRGDPKKWMRYIGYAPECPALVPYMTGKEMLHVFARFKGVADRSRVVSNVFKFVGIKKQNTLWREYSLGEQKILSIAIALLGVPPILLLDEPISDVDPVSRLEIMHVLEVLKSSRTMSIIISSHGMKHCEILCDRAALLIGGKIETLGNSLLLNRKYGGCYTITIMTLASRRNDVHHQNRIVKVMKEEFHQCVLSHMYKGVLCFNVGKTYTDWREIFPKMVHIQQELEFKDFLISDMTLEHIFVGLARKQMLVVGQPGYVGSNMVPK